MVKTVVKPQNFGKAVLKAVNDEYQKDLKVYQRKVIPLLKQEIIESIFIRGVSPVSGFGKYKAYSKSYKEQIRRGKGKFANKDIRPINLTLSGDLLKSIKGRPIANGFTIWFSDKKAKWHDKEGAGRSKVIRRMLPNDNEKFNQVITRAIDNLFKKTF